MKIKHWQGYGTVNAQKIKDSNTLHIRVSGNHEYGVYRNDDYDLFNWLVKRFDKKQSDYMEWARKYPKFEIIDGYEKINGLDVEVCDYMFNY